MWSKLKSFFKSLFAAKKEQKVVETPVSSPIVVEKPTQSVITKDYIYKTLAVQFSMIAGAKEKGENTDHGGAIDKVQIEAGGRLPEPYCADTVTAIIIRACKELGIHYPKNLYRGSSSQGFKNQTDSKYVSSTYSKWCAFVHTNSNDPSHGHTGFGISDSLDADGNFKTAEGNFSNQINYFMKNRFYVNKYVDVVQAILDQYNLEHK